MFKKFGTKGLVCCAACIAIAFVLSYIKIVQLPESGSITLCSMFFICFAAYCYGPGIGIACGTIYGILQFLQKPWALTIPMFLCDYLFAFAALGLAGFFHKRKYKGLLCGYILGVIGRGAFHSLAGYLFYMEYATDFYKKYNIVKFYPLIYNYGFLLAEMILTIVILLIAPVKAALEKIHNMTQNG